MNKRLNFGGDPVRYRDSGKTCLGGGMRCASASSIILIRSKDFYVLASRFII